MSHVLSAKSLLATIVLALSAPVWAGDLKPGQWEVTQTIEGAELPEQLTEARTKQECMTEAETADMEAAMRQGWQESGCQDIEVSRDGDRLEARAVCEAQGRTTQVHAQLTLHSDEHYTSDVTMENDGTVTTHRDANWSSADCQPTAE